MPRFRRLLCALLFGGSLVWTLSPAAGQGQANKAPKPEAADIEKALTTVRELYKADYANAQPPQMVALAGKLLQESMQAKNEPAMRWVLLSEARDLAARGGDVTRALQAADELAARFAVDRLQVRMPALEFAAAGAITPDAGTRMTRLLLTTVEEAVAADNLEAAEKLIALADTAARGAGSVNLLNTVAARKKGVEEIKAFADQVKAANDALAKDPKDAAANLTLGKYNCFIKGDWTKGIPQIIQGNDAKLQALARKDLAAVRGTPNQQADAAASWWTQAESEAGRTREMMQNRAYHYYFLAVPKLVGASQTRAIEVLRTMPRTHLSELEEFDAKVGFGKFGKDGRLNFGDNPPITINGKPYPNALSMHAVERGMATAKYRLDKEYQWLAGAVGLNDTVGRNQVGPLAFRVLADGKMLWASPPLRTAGGAIPFRVSVANVEVLELQVLCPGSFAYCHSVWLDPYLVK
jgi:hypothetical protein